MPSYSSKSWNAEIGERARALFPVKLVLITAGICAFMAGYFLLLHNPPGPAFKMPLTALDRRIPFQPAWVVAYFTLWFYVSLGPGLQRDLRALAHYGVWVGLMSLTALVCFRFWPTGMPHDVLETGDFPGYGILRGVDKSGNTCPSMHVAAAVFTGIRIDAILRFARTPATLRFLNATWAAAIVYSTLAVRQHCLWDVLGGALLGGVFAVVSLKFVPKSVP